MLEVGIGNGLGWWGSGMGWGGRDQEWWDNGGFDQIPIPKDKAINLI